MTHRDSLWFVVFAVQPAALRQGINGIGCKGANITQVLTKKQAFIEL
jgi:hypothetical protein